MSTAFLVKRRGAAVLGGLDAAVRRHPTDQTRLVTFHAVGNRVDGDVHGIYDLTPAEFGRHVDAIVGAAAEAGLPFRRLGEWPAPGIVVTFDDGYADLVGTVAPVLSERGIPFHCFVTGDRLDAGDTRYLDRAALAELAAVPLAGIGAHGWRHAPLDAMQPGERDHDLRASRSSLEDLLQRTVDTMSYPYGRGNGDVRGAAQRAGFARAACSTWGFAPPESDPLLLPRIDLWAGDSPRTVRHKVLGHWNWFGRLS